MAHDGLHRVEGVDMMRDRRRLAAALILSTLLAATGARAQLPDRSLVQPARSATDRRTGFDEQTRWQQIETGELGFEAPIDPDTYVLSPGDRLLLSIWGAADQIVPLVVTADGALVVPTVGLLDVRELTLAAAAARLAEICRPLYPHAATTLTLVRPALLRIAVTGLVGDPGLHDAPATWRLDDLLRTAGGLRGGADERRVALHRRDGAVLACDLLAWRTGDDPAGNPPLRSGDRVHVPSMERGYRVRGLLPWGAEDLPARSSIVDRPFEAHSRLVGAREGDRLGFVLRACGGLGPDHCAAGVWVERGELQAGVWPPAAVQRLWVQLGEAETFALQPGDVIDIPFCNEWVAVGGAVTRPGLYPYLPGQTVADYVYAAGGPSLYGRSQGWRLRDPATGRERNVAAEDSVAAGATLRVPERRTQTISSLLTPVGTAVAVLVSILALSRD